MLIKFNIAKKIICLLIFWRIICLPKALGLPSLASAQVVNEENLVALSQSSIEYARARCGWSVACGEDSSVAAFGSLENNETVFSYRL